MQTILKQKQGRNSATPGGPRFYLPIRAVNFVHDLGDNDLLFNGVFEFLIFGVLVDFQVSSLEWLPNTTGEKQILYLRNGFRQRRHGQNGDRSGDLRE